MIIECIVYTNVASYTKNAEKKNVKCMWVFPVLLFKKRKRPYVERLCKL